MRSPKTRATQRDAEAEARITELETAIRAFRYAWNAYEDAEVIDTRRHIDRAIEARRALFQVVAK